MKNFKVLLLCLILLFAMTSCKKSKSKDEIYEFPLRMGNSWMYLWTFEYYDPQVGEMVTMGDTCQVWVEGIANAPDGESCYNVEYYYESMPNAVCSIFLKNRSDGLYELGRIGASHLPPLKNPARKVGSNPFPRPDLASYSKDADWLLTPRLTIPRVCNEGVNWGYGSHEAKYYLPHQSLIMGKEKVELPIGNRNAIKKKVTVHLDEINWDYYDFYAAEGTVMFYSEDSETIHDAEGNCIGEFPRVEKLVLLDYHLN